MSWYIEFEVENEEAEKRFWNCIERIGKAAKDYKIGEPWSDTELIEAAIDFAKDMNYIE